MFSKEVGKKNILFQFVKIGGLYASARRHFCELYKMNIFCPPPKLEVFFMFDYELMYYEIKYDSKYCKGNLSFVYCEEDILPLVDSLKDKGFTNIRCTKVLNIIF